MSVEDNKTLARRFLGEELNRKNLRVVDESCTADYVMHLPGGVEIHGPEELKQLIISSLTAFPDAHVTVEDLIAEGDKVVCRSTRTGTHEGE